MFPLTLINALDITKNECNQIVLVYTKLSQNALSFRNTVYYICPFPNRFKKMEKWRLVLKYHALHECHLQMYTGSDSHWKKKTDNNNSNNNSKVFIHQKIKVHIFCYKQV